MERYHVLIKERLQKLIKHIKLVVMLFGVLHLAQSCVDTFDFESTEFQSALVVEATITDEEAIQHVRISRTFPLDTVLMAGENNAIVSVTDSNGGTYNFTEVSSGEYSSTVPFAVNSGLTYKLNIITADGNIYESEDTDVPATTEIDRIYAERDFKDDVDEGMFIYVDSYDPSGQSKYYSYEYEETYKIIAPFWSPEDAYAVSLPPTPAVATRPRTQEELVG